MPDFAHYDHKGTSQMLLRESFVRRTVPQAVAAIGCSLWAVGAHAAPVFNLNGDATQTPYFQVHTYSGLQDHTSALPDSLVINEGLLTSNNTGVPGQTRVDTFTANGATVRSETSAVPGGFYFSRNTASLTIENANADDGYYALGGYGSMTSVQFFSAEAEAQRASFRWRVTGVETATPIGSCVPEQSTFDLCSTARMDFAATTDDDVNYFDLLYSGNYGTMTEFGPGEYSYSIAGFNLGEVITLGFWTSAFVQINPGQLAQGENAFYAANYGNTFELIGVDLFDAADNLITDWTLLDLNTGETVFNADGRITASVPEPGSLALLGLGLLGIGMVRRGRPLNRSAG